MTEELGNFSTLDEQFEATGGVTGPLNTLMNQYHHYADGLLLEQSLQGQYLQLGEDKKKAELIDKTSDEAKEIRRKQSILGSLIMFMRSSSPSQREVETEDGSMVMIDNLAQRGQVMKYPNAAVWMLYKYHAYNPNLSINESLAEIDKPVSLKPITTWGDLIEHSLARPGYICGRRLHFLATELARKNENNELLAQIEAVDPWEMTPDQAHLFLQFFTPEMELPEIFTTETFRSLNMRKFQKKWASLEYDKDGKWVNYPQGRERSHIVRGLGRLFQRLNIQES